MQIQPSKLITPPYPNPAPSRLYPPPAPVPAGTACFLVGVAMAYSLYPAEATATAMASAAAVPVGIGFWPAYFLIAVRGCAICCGPIFSAWSESMP
ncbi:MAG: hypothetical protein HC929_09870 [Leptolyngbyaceae cyanobacterium SM2_5_2]|nr:hypothetical protein [Leptolyngbyaceae cyanobacterium SM2_5_2]